MSGERLPGGLPAETVEKLVFGWRRVDAYYLLEGAEFNLWSEAKAQHEAHPDVATRVFGPDPDAPSRRLDNFQADIDNLNITGREADSSSGPAAPTAG